MPLYVIQEHWASTYHFDFRFKIDGILKSWAVLKEVPQDYGVKRLAVGVEDHVLEYVDFSGVVHGG